MLYEALDVIREKLNNHITAITQSIENVQLGDVARLGNGQTGGGETELQNNSVIISLANIEEEHALKNNYPVRELGGAYIASKPVLYLNVYLLITANFSDYEEALKHIGHVLGFFQANKTSNLTVPRVAGTITLTFNLHNISLENLNNLWVVMGGQYRPSVLYKTKLFVVQESPGDSQYPILDIQSNEKLV